MAHGQSTCVGGEDRAKGKQLLGGSLKKTFHEPANFATLSGMPTLVAPFVPRIVSASVRGYESRWDRSLLPPSGDH